MTDCDFNRAALHPAYPIKRRTSAQRKQAPESVDTQRASAIDPLENNIRKERTFPTAWQIRQIDPKIDRKLAFGHRLRRTHVKRMARGAPARLCAILHGA
jgi:hypothetical protein